MSENRLPFNIKKIETLSSSGTESAVSRMDAIAHEGDTRHMVLKEMRSTEIADIAQMEKLKQQYEVMQSDPDFGRFVIPTHFLKAQRTSAEPPRAYLVQKFIPGKRVDELTDAELYRDKAVVAELLAFVRAAIAMLERTKHTPEYKPDFYADRKNFFGNFLHNPRYSGNILVADAAADLPQRIYFVDTGTLFGVAHKKDVLKTIRHPVSHALQMTQMQRWAKKLEECLK